jgi:hypothetical protein
MAAGNAGKHRSKERRPREKGAAAMELALLIPIFVLIVAGVMDFGDAWYIHHTITNATREGARAGIRYQSSGEVRTCPTVSDVQQVVKDYLKKFFPADYVDDPGKVQIKVDPPPVCRAGENIGVGIVAQKEWFILGPLTGMSPFKVGAITTMKLE